MDECVRYYGREIKVFFDQDWPNLSPHSKTEIMNQLKQLWEVINEQRIHLHGSVSRRSRRAKRVRAISFSSDVANPVANGQTSDCSTRWNPTFREIPEDVKKLLYKEKDKDNLDHFLGGKDTIGCKTAFAMLAYRTTSDWILSVRLRYFYIGFFQLFGFISVGRRGGTAGFMAKAIYNYEVRLRIRTASEDSLQDVKETVRKFIACGKRYSQLSGDLSPSTIARLDPRYRTKQVFRCCHRNSDV